MEIESTEYFRERRRIGLQHMVPGMYDAVMICNRVGVGCLTRLGGWRGEEGCAGDEMM